MSSSTFLSTKLVESFARRKASSSNLRRTGSTESSSTTFQDLEADLRLSAAVGVALLEEKNELERRLVSLDTINQKLLDRLANSVKDNEQLQKRLEDTVANLEQAEANNRALLVTLENDRKRISRLSAESARLVTTTAQFKSTSTLLADTRQELVFEQKRATIAETRAEKLDLRMRRATADLEEIRQDKVLRTKKSFKTLEHIKSKLNRKISSPDLVENPEAIELLKLVETLVSENELLRSASAELTEMLDVSRDEQSDLRDEMENQRTINDDDGEESMLDAKAFLSPDGLGSSAVTRGLFDFDISPTPSPNSTQSATFSRSWAPPSTLGNLSEDVLPRKNVELEDDLNRRAALRRAEIASMNGAGGVGGGIIPIGRRRRPLSMNVDLSRRTSVEREHDSQSSLPPSPVMDVNSYSARSTSTATFSDVDETAQSRLRHPRPLSLALGTSIFSHSHLEERLSSPLTSSSSLLRARQSPHSPSLVPIPSFETTPAAAQPTTPSRNSIRTSIPLESPSLSAINSAAQTPRPDPAPSDEVHYSTQLNSPEQPMRALSDRHTHASSLSRRASIATSDFSEREKHDHSLTSLDTSSLAVDRSTSAMVEQRTAALASLIAHTSKILSRLKTADIVSQEKRLMKQKLPGGVRHLALANLKEVVHDIEGLRPHFRRVLEIERSTASKESSMVLSPDQAAESLIVRRDFVSLVKLLRDLLLETSRLRSIVNRVQMEPALASEIRDLDAADTFDAVLVTPKVAVSAGSGAVATVARLLLVGPASDAMEANDAESNKRSTARPSNRPIGKLSSATVNVAFGGRVGGVVTVDGMGGRAEESASDKPTLSDIAPPSLPRRKSGKRELNSIFAGAHLSKPTSPSAAASATSASSSSAHPSATRSLNPFSRLMSYRPTLSTTANSLLDSFQQHAIRSDHPFEPSSLLDRTLHKRGLSDSSIRSTFVAHANPHHRIISPATLALSSETTIADDVGPIIFQNLEEDMIVKQLTELNLAKSSSSLSSSSSILRKSSMGQLRSRPSQAQLRSTSASSTAREIVPPVPSMPLLLPEPITMSPSSSPSNSSYQHAASIVDAAPAASLTGSLFDNLSSWASKAAAMSPMARAAMVDDEASSTGRKSDRSSSLVREVHAKNLERER